LLPRKPFALQTLSLGLLPAIRTQLLSLSLLLGKPFAFSLFAREPIILNPRLFRALKRHPRQAHRP
jgi:hypothetical protein